MPIVSAPRLLVDGALVGPGAVVVDGDRITAVLDRVPEPAPDHLALTDGIVTPGLVDLQLNGFVGHDLIAADERGWDAVRTALPAHGVTSFLGTFITAPLPDLLAGLVRARTARARAVPGAARLLGVHLEGPFLSPRRKGAHDSELMCSPTPETVTSLLSAGGSDQLVALTLAPEREQAIEAISVLRDAGVVVSLGHSDATAVEAAAAVEAGARMVTHVFNAMRPLHQRDPGLVAVALTDPRLAVGLICDLHHVAPLACRLVFEAAAGRVVLVSDAIAAAGMPPGRYELGGEVVVVAGPGELPRREDTTIAGSSLTLDLAVRNAVRCGVDPAAALAAACEVPARVLGRTDVGGLVPGGLADLVWWSDDLEPRRTWIGGVEAGKDAAALTGSA